jgi:uncharacterized membrane protein
MNENSKNPAAAYDRLSAELQEVRARLDRIEVRLGFAPPLAPPPPVPVAPGPPPAAPKFQVPTPPPIRERLQEGAADAEFRFGSVVLPRLGAAVILLGIAYLVGLGIARGWITPLHQFWGAVILCLGAIGVGAWKRSESFEFGQVLIGLGSCGLYLTFAGGHVFLNLYDGRALLAQILALSLANLVYGALSPSRTFVGIGLLGGMWASLLPMQERQIEAALWIHAAIVAVTAFVIARHRWKVMAIAAWLVSSVAILWPALSDGPWTAQLAVVYGSTLALAFAYAWGFEDWAFDPKAAFIPFSAVATGLVAYVVGRQAGPGFTWHELLFGLAMALLSLAVKRPVLRSAFLIAGVLAPFVFAPLGLRSLWDAWAYVGLSLAAAALATRFYAKPSLAFAGIGFGLGLMMYLARAFSVVNTLGVAEESLFIVALIAVLALCAWTVDKLTDESQSVVFVALALSSPLVSRLFVVLLGAPEIGASAPLSLIYAMVFMSAIGAAVALRSRWALLSIFAWLAFFAAGGAYLFALERELLSFSVEVFVLAAMASAVLISGAGLSRATSAREAAAVLAAFTGWGLFTRLFYIVATQPAVGMEKSPAITLAWIVFAALLIGLGFGLNLKALRISSFAVFAATLGKVLLHDLSQLDPAIRVVLLILLGTVMISGGYWYIKRFDKPTTGAAA